MFLGLAALEQPQLDNCPSLQALAMAWTTPAAATEWAKDVSLLPVCHFRGDVRMATFLEQREWKEKRVDGRKDHMERK